MKIREVRPIPLLGRTPRGGWDHDVDPSENLHTLVEVLTGALQDFAKLRENGGGRSREGSGREAGAGAGERRAVA